MTDDDDIFTEQINSTRLHLLTILYHQAGPSMNISHHGAIITYMPYISNMSTAQVICSVSSVALVALLSTMLDEISWLLHFSLAEFNLQLMGIMIGFLYTQILSLKGYYTC